MADTSFDINNGANQIAPNAMTQNQYFYGEEFARKILGSKDKPLSLVVLGAGVDATIGLPTSADLIPRIVDFLETDEGKTLDAILRKAIGRVHFHFDKFVSTAIDRLAKDLDREIVSICHNINDELANNASLDESQRKLGMLIVRLFKKVLDFKKGAEIDAETMNLIEEVFNTVVKDDSIIDLSHLNYTDTFKNIIVEILQKSIHESNNPILRHIYKNMLDIEQLLAGYFYGFYTGQNSYIRDYLYISWILWAYLVSEEQQKAQENVAIENKDNHTIYDQLEGKDCQVITFNYTSYASQTSPTALYFHGSLKEYVDVENNNDFLHDDLTTIDLEDFFKNQLAAEISFDPDHKSIPIPSFLPPLKLRPVISKHYIDTWYHASQMVLRASKIIILGYSFSSADNYFCDMLRENHDAQIIIIDKNMETASRNVCRCLQLDANRYTKQIKDGHEIRKYNNRVTIIGADLSDVNLDDVEL